MITPNQKASKRNKPGKRPFDFSTASIGCQIRFRAATRSSISSLGDAGADTLSVKSETKALGIVGLICDETRCAVAFFTEIADREVHARCTSA